MTTPDALRRALSDNAAATSAGARANGQIREAAEARMADIDDRLAGLRARAFSDEPSGQEYQDLIRERGELALVLGRSEVDE